MTGAQGSTLEAWLREILRCPACRSTLVEEVGEAGAAELRCTADAPEGCGRIYRIDSGVPVLLVDEGRLPSSG